MELSTVRPNYSTSAFNETLSDNKGSGRMDIPTRIGAVFGYYFFDRYGVVNPYSQVTVPGFAATNQGQTQMINLGLTTTFNSSTVNDLRLAYLRDVNQTGQPTAGQGLGVTLASQGFVTPWGPAGGISPINPAYEGVTNLMFNNFSAWRPAGRLEGIQQHLSDPRQRHQNFGNTHFAIWNQPPLQPDQRAEFRLL